MKNTFTILSLVVLTWGCAKKMTPAKSETPSSNTGSSSTISTPVNSEKPVSTPSSTSTTTPSAATAGATTASALTPATPKNAEEAALLAGQTTYNAKCGRCHAHKVTSDYTSERWVNIMTVMAIKANLNETEKANVTAYVRANAKK